MDKLEINDKFAVILFKDKTGGAWCKKVTGAEARLILGMAIAFTMNIAQLARMKDEKLVDSYTTA